MTGAASIPTGVIISHKGMRTLGWERTDPRPWAKLSARWKHVSGWTLEHCGHPTALWPWALFDPRGRMHVAPNGRAWPDLHKAAMFVANLEGIPNA